MNKYSKLLENTEDKRNAKEFTFKYILLLRGLNDRKQKTYKAILMPEGFDKNFTCICNFSFSSYGFIIPAINKRKLFILK